MIIALFVIWIFVTNSNNSWKFVSLEIDERKSYFVTEFDVSQKIHLIDIISTKVQRDITIERNETDRFIEVGATDNKEQVLLLDSRRGLYRPAGKDPSLKLWVEEINPSDFSVYKQKTLEDLNSILEGDISNKSYSNTNYYIGYLGNVPDERLKEVSTVGVSYIFFEKENIVVFMNFFNTKYQGCFDSKSSECIFYPEEKLLNKNDIELIIKTIIDNAQ